MESSFSIRVDDRVRVCSQSSQPDDGASQMNERQEGLGEFVVASGDAPELLDAAAKTLTTIPEYTKTGKSLVADFNPILLHEK